MRQASDESCTRHRLTGGGGGVRGKSVLKVLENLLPHCLHSKQVSHAVFHDIRSAFAPPPTGSNSKHFLVGDLLLSKPALGIRTKNVIVSE